MSAYDDAFGLLAPSFDGFGAGIPQFELVPVRMTGGQALALIPIRLPDRTR